MSEVRSGGAAWRGRLAGWTLGVFGLGGAALAGDCAECRLDGARADLCGPHAEREREGLEEAEEGLESEKPGLRERALRKAAGLTRFHENAPSPKVVGLLARGLADVDVGVRRTALGLLLDGQNPEATVEALLDEWERVEKEWRELARGLDDMHAARGKPQVGGISQEDFRRHMEVPGYVELLLRAMGRVPDERIEKELVGVLKRGPDGRPACFLLGAADGALALGSERAVGAVADLLGELGRALERGRVARAYPVTGQPRLMDAMFALAREPREEDYVAIADDVAAAAEAAGLAAPPRTLAGPKEWDAWWRAARDAFAVEPGRLATPVRLELDAVAAGGTFCGADDDEDEGGAPPAGRGGR